MSISNEDTICAIATPPGPGGIGVVRISGPESVSILERLWRGRVGSRNFEPRRLYLGSVIDSEGNFIDRILAVWMPTPHTYTAQEMVELSCHGSPVVLRRVFEACINCGARPAGPGEFTRRAFIAGKLDLAQAEGVADLIHATSDRAAKVAASQLEGRLSSKVSTMNEELARIRTFVEATIDFPEEKLGSLDGEGVAKRIGRVAETVQRLSETFREGRMIRDGVRVAITGRVNAGKSSLLNRLVGCDRALVHKSPGTTRDVVEEMINLEGTPFRLRDTAGVRHSGCEVEAMGMKVARLEIEQADIVLVVFDGSQKFGEEDEAVLNGVRDKRAVVVVNKSDLPPELDVSCIGGRLGDAQPLFVSALTGQGLKKLSKKLLAVAACDEGHLEGVVVTSARHKAALDQAVVEMGRAGHSISEGWPLECTAQHLANAQDHLGSITGAVTSEELLDRIFSTFCIGK